MGDYEKVILLNNEIEASLIDDILNERDIPHIMVSYHSLAYDGIFQMEAWGHVESEPEYHQVIKEIYQEILDSFEDNE